MLELDGFYVHHPGSSSMLMFTPEIVRQGQAATFVADIIAVHGTVSFVITVLHRNREDTTWTGTPFTAIGSAGLAQKDVGNLKELIRFGFHFASGTVGDFVYLALSSIGWREYN